MKTIGMIGGMSWSQPRFIIVRSMKELRRKQCLLHSAKIILNSLDFQEIERLQTSENWAETANILKRAAKSVERAGADFLIICTNTMHIVAPEITEHLSIPVLHIADATGEKLLRKELRMLDY